MHIFGDPFNNIKTCFTYFHQECWTCLNSLLEMDINGVFARTRAKQKAFFPLHGANNVCMKSRAWESGSPRLSSCLPNPPQLCCNPSLLFNKQFVSDVSNANSNLIVCEMCMEALPALRLPVCTTQKWYSSRSPPPPHTSFQVCVHVRARMQEQSLRVCNYI